MSADAGAAPTIPAPGFADPTRDSQQAFRAVLDALAHPGRLYTLTGPAEPPAVLGSGLGAIALTVLDEECTLWLGGRLGGDPEVASWLAFHTGVRVVQAPDDADFVFADPSSRPPLRRLRSGTEEAPHQSATLVLDIRGLTGSTRFLATGPGIDGSTVFEAVWADEDFATEWNGNRSTFPRGVDVLLVDHDSVVGLPRTTRLASITEPVPTEREA